MKHTKQLHTAPQQEGDPQTQAAQVVIDVDQLGYSVGSPAKHILNDVSLRIDRGDFVCLLGPSGCGKTTLLYLIAGFNQPTTGVIRTGLRLGAAGTDCMMVFQDANAALFPWLTVQQNVEYGLKRADRIPSIQSMSERRDELLALVKLTGHEDKFPHHLSGGMKQRLQLARALSAKRPIILMDEPLAALDALSKSRLQQELRDIAAAQNATVVYVTHDVQEAAILADRVLVMTHGPSAGINRDVRSPVTERAIGDAKVAAFAGELFELVTTQKEHDQ